MPHAHSKDKAIAVEPRELVGFSAVVVRLEYPPERAAADLAEAFAACYHLSRWPTTGQIDSSQLGPQVSEK